MPIVLALTMTVNCTNRAGGPQNGCIDGTLYKVVNATTVWLVLPIARRCGSSSVLPTLGLRSAVPPRTAEQSNSTNAHRANADNVGT
jgi:hypothetical protein